MKKILFALYLILGIFLFSFSQVQTFTPVTSQVGISVIGDNMGQACAWADIDNDGDLDIAFSYSYPSLFKLYRNDGGTYSDITASSGLNSIGASTILWAEINGDDFTDMLTASNAYLNNGDGTFSFLGQVAGHTSSIADFDNDGNVDILDISPPSIKFGNGDGSFGNATSLQASNILSSVCFDFDNDGFIDILFGAAESGATKLFKNNGDATFSDVTSGSGISFSYDVYGVVAGDINNDGLMDIYAALHKGQLSSPGNALLKNNGDGTFDNITTSSGAIGQASSRTASFADYNNDSWLDILVDDHYKGNHLYHNNGDETFIEVAEELNIHDAHPTAGIGGDYFGTSWGDYNNDGAIDFFGSGHWSIHKLYENQFCPNNFLALNLVGTESNRNGIGVKVKLKIDDTEIFQTIIVGDGGCNFNSLPLEFGLGQNTIIDFIEIYWTNSTMQTITNVGANSFLTVIEGDPVNIAENNNDINIECYPNPFTTNFSVKVEKLETPYLDFDLFDINGKTIVQFHVDVHKSVKNNINFNLEEYNLDPGIYYLKISSEKLIKTIKLVKQ